MPAVYRTVPWRTQTATGVDCWTAEEKRTGAVTQRQALGWPGGDADRQICGDHFFFLKLDLHQNLTGPQATCLSEDKSSPRLSWAACGSVLEQDTEPQIAPDVQLAPCMTEEWQKNSIHWCPYTDDYTQPSVYDCVCEWVNVA